VARLRAKLRQLDSLKKDDLVKRLEAKEHECLEYRARLEPMVAGLTTVEEPKTPQALERELERKAAELKAQMEAERKRIEQLMDEMAHLKTTVRERINLPPFI
jgi:predicted nuclease with TOPRIM domain